MANLTPAQEHEWLILAQRERDPQAFAKLVAAHQHRVRAVLRKLNHGHQALADELGTVREIVTRLLRRFERDGWVALSRECITLCDRPALSKLAGLTTR